MCELYAYRRGWVVPGGADRYKTKKVWWQFWWQLRREKRGKRDQKSVTLPLRSGKVEAHLTFRKGGLFLGF